MPLGWWKAMELTFGALLGAAFGACAWRVGRKGEAPALPATPWFTAFGEAAIAVALTAGAEEFLPVRFGYTVGGAVLAAMVLYSESLAWQTAITATYAAFAWDSLRTLRGLPEWAMWAAAISTTAVVALTVARHAKARTMFLLLTWTAVAAALRYLARLGPEQVTMLVVFAALAIAISRIRYAES